MSEFNLEILTPGKQVFSNAVQEVIIPAYDGETGILAGHENFVGVLGTGPLKLVREGNDYWYMVSSGVYEVRDGKVSILAELVEGADQFDVEAEKSQLETLTGQLTSLDLNSPAGQKAKIAHERAARVDVHKRTALVN